MRWIEPAKSLAGEIRVVRRFLYCPLVLGRERRWLEYANIVEMYDERSELWTKLCFEDEKTTALELVETSGEKLFSSFSKYRLFKDCILKMSGTYRSRSDNERVLTGIVLQLEGIILQLARQKVDEIKKKKELKDKYTELKELELKQEFLCPESEQRIDILLSAIAKIKEGM